MIIGFVFCAIIFFLIGCLFATIVTTTRCKHVYEIFNKEKVSFGEGDYICWQYNKIWMRCNKCGKVKSKRM